MGSSRPNDRSLGEATFLPQWMKGKLDSRYDYSETTISPPADDTFFYIRYSNYQEANSSNNTTKESFRPLNEILGNKPEPSVASKEAKNVDFSKHPLACQSFVPNFQADKVNEPKVVVANKPKIRTPTANDDFTSDKVAECGRSIVHVANQIMSSKFGKSISADAASRGPGDEAGAASTSSQQPKASRSLPATPLTSPSISPEGSPKSRRRAYANRFFTAAFVPEGERHKNGWLLTSILGQSRELIGPKIEEEDETFAEQLPARALNRKKSISSQNLTYLGQEKAEPAKPTQILQAKPSELREMNFWSPTSM